MLVDDVEARQDEEDRQDEDKQNLLTTAVANIRNGKVACGFPLSFAGPAKCRPIR